MTRRIPGDQVEENLELLGLSVEVTYLDAPQWIRRVFRGGLGLRLSYVAWQRQLRRVARHLHAQKPFDVVHHVTFGSIWLPVGLAVVPAPLVIGPAGGGPRIPIRLWSALGARGALSEALRRGAQIVNGANPAVRRGWRKATVILVQNTETREALPARFRSKCRIRHHATASLAAELPSRPGGKRVIFAGRLVPWKGALLAVEALEYLPGWHLTIVGSGPDEQRIRNAIRAASLDEQATLVPWLERPELHRLISQCDVTVVPSLRDDSPFIVAEAQTLGVPVAGFAQGGMRTFAELRGTRIELAALSGNATTLAQKLAEAVLKASEDRPPEDPAHAFGIATIAEELNGLYRGVARRDS